VVLEEVVLTLTSSIRDGRIMRGNESDTAWNARERLRDAVSIGTGELAIKK
jgi:hypothetical protein